MNKIKIGHIIFFIVLVSFLFRSQHIVAKQDQDLQYVIVLLKKDPEVNKIRPLYAEERIKRIRKIQKSVIGSISKGTFKPVYLFSTIFALTGWVDRNAKVELLKNPYVKNVITDRRIRVSMAQAGPFIGANETRREYGVDGSGIMVAVFDTGIDTDHPDFEGRILTGGSFLNQQKGLNIEDGHGHGTNVAGIIAGAGKIAPVGIAPGATLLIYKVLDDSGYGYISDWAMAIDDAVLKKETYPQLLVSNSSLGSVEGYKDCPCDTEDSWAELLSEAYTNLKEAGIVNFAAAGNEGYRGALSLPGCLNSTVSVGAVYDMDYGREPDDGYYIDPVTGDQICFDETTQADMITCFTNINLCLDLLAPGVNIRSCDILGAAFIAMTGTSQATPMAAGAAALMLDFEPSLSPEDIEDIIITNGVSVDTGYDSVGVLPRLDLKKIFDFLYQEYFPCKTSQDAGKRCSDRNPCTKEDVCNDDGTCAGTAYSCKPTSDCILSSECDGLGGCIYEFAREGTPCDDGNPDTRGDICDGAGECKGLLVKFKSDSKAAQKEGCGCNVTSIDQSLIIFILLFFLMAGRLHRLQQ